MVWSVFQRVAVAIAARRPRLSPASRHPSSLASKIFRAHSIQPTTTSLSFLSASRKTTIACYCLWFATSSLTASSSWLDLRGVVATPTTTNRNFNFGRSSRLYTRSSSGSSRNSIHSSRKQQQQYCRRTMSSFVTLRNGGTITVAPKNEGDQSALVIIAHGLGDTAEGFADVAEVRTTYRRTIYSRVGPRIAVRSMFRFASLFRQLFSSLVDR
jgi:hypothetical protein